ncbi:MAG TPA: tetratricopeptide repeat protein [Candidatus Aminicenantes bacterium]|nr:tetratricopeptide repeat protein [Candidatus Aminicenantes bacterium]
MNKKLAYYLFILLVFVISFSSCARQLMDNQLLFGVQAAKRDLWNEAIFRWKKVVLFDPDSAAAHNNLAVAYEQKGLWEEAKNEYEIALKLGRGNAQIKANYQNFKKTHEPFNKDKKDEKN